MADSVTFHPEDDIRYTPSTKEGRDLSGVREIRLRATSEIKVELGAEVTYQVVEIHRETVERA